MDIKDSYLHGTVGVIKSIDIDADKLIYKLADVASTTITITLPLATIIANGLMSKEDKIAINSLVNYVTLDTTLIISGAKTFSSLVEFTSEDGIAPFVVTSNTVVTNLNADRLDGLHSFDFIKYDYHIDSSTTTMSTRHIGYGYAEYGFICSGPAISIGSGDGYIMQILQEVNSSNTYIRYGNPDGFGAWKQLAFVGEATVSNADMLDGYHESAFLRYRGETGTDQESTLWDSLGMKEYINALPDGIGDVYNYGEVISLPSRHVRFDIYVSEVSTSDHTKNGIYVRSGWSSNKQPWRRLAFISDTVAAAKKFVPRYITNLNTDGINEFFSSGFQPNNRPSHHNYTTGFTVCNSELAYTYQFAFDTYGDVYTRHKNTTEWQPWRRLAFTTDTVEVANKLSTTRYLWGQPFDGSGNVKGVIKGVPYVSFETYDYEGGSAGYVGRGGTNSNDLSITTYGENYIEFSTKSIERMRITKDGRVGIGVVSPTHDLHINGAIKAEYNPDYNLSHDIVGEAHFYNDSYSDPATGILAAIKVNGVIAQSSGNVLLCTTSGNVGIGTLTPVSELHVVGRPIFNHNGRHGDAGLMLIRNDASITGWDRAIFAYYPNLEAGAHANFHIGKADSAKNGGYISYYHAGDSSGNNCMTIGLYATDDILNVTANRRVGINTTTPEHTLDVNGSSIFRNHIYVKKYHHIFMNTGEEGVYYTDDGLYWHNANNEYVRSLIKVNSSGYVGIGVALPTQKLEVGGNVKATSFIGNLTGNADTATTTNKSKTINITADEFAKAQYSGFYNVSKSTTSNPLPDGDQGGHVAIHAAWDNGNNTAGLDLIVNDDTSSNLYFRARVGGGKIGTWKTLLDSSNYSSTLDNRYYTESEADNRFVNVAGDTMTGGLTFSTDSAITWSRNTDYASIRFQNTGDGDTNSYLDLQVGDNGNEYIRFSRNAGGTVHEMASFKADGIRVNGYLLATSSSKTIKIGSENSTYCHYITTADAHWFNTGIQVNGSLTPYHDNMRLLGSSTLRWASVSAVNFYGNLTGAVNFANNTWNNVGDDVAIGDCNNSGVLGIKSLNSNIPGFRFYNSSNTFIGQFTVDNNVAKWNGNTLLDANNAKESVGEFGYVMRKYTIDASALDENTWYPVTIELNQMPYLTVRIECIVTLNSGTKPSWSTHSAGFSVRKIWEVNGYGWGTNPINRLVYVSDSSFATTDPVKGIGQLGNASVEYVHVRGGGKYFFYTSHNKVPILRTSTYTASNLSVSPTTTVPRTILSNVDVYQLGYYTSSTISSLPVYKQSVICTISASGTLGFADVIPEGRELHVIIKNTSSSAITITIPSTMINVMGENLKIDGNSYGELNILSCGSYYVRGVS